MSHGTVWNVENGSDPWNMGKPLSDMEIRVLRIMATGKNMTEAGKELYIGLPTVKTHLGSAYRKLGVKSITGAVWKAMELGYIEPPPLKVPKVQRTVEDGMGKWELDFGTPAAAD